MIRCAVLGVAGRERSADALVLCQDLERMIVNSKPGMPVRVVFEEITDVKTVMGWWYHPESAERRSAFTATAYDYLFIAEDREVVTQFPELFFEGAQQSRRRFPERKTRVMILMTDSAGSSGSGDSNIAGLTELTYRVADGCGIEVVPAALAWQDVTRHHILPSRSLLKRRANSFLAAAAIWCQISGEAVPKASLTTDFVVRKTAELMARSARDAVTAASRRRHYGRPFEGIVRMHDRERLQYLYYHAGGTANPSLPDALRFITAAQGGFVEQYSTADWFESGFDRFAYPLDLVCGSLQEMEPLLDRNRYTSTEFPSPKMPRTVSAVYNRNPPGDANGELTLRSLENLLMDGYNFARDNGLVFIPYQIAWARLWSVNPDYVKPAPGKTTNDWLNYMLAGMMHTALTGGYHEPPERNIPVHYNDSHPRGYHRIAARTGWQCMRQLSTLKMSRNTIISSRGGWNIDGANPGFVRIRLLEPPLAPVRVLCAPSDPAALALSQSVFEFDSSNFDIEQVVRCSAATGESNLFCDLLISAVSDDGDIDGVSTKHTFLVNSANGGKSGFVFSTDSVTLADKSFVTLKPEVRPVDLVFVSVMQNGVETASLCFSPEYYAEHPICLFPDRNAIAAGGCEVVLKTKSRDSRFDGIERHYAFRLDYGGMDVPDLRVVAPEHNARIDGPAFVSAEAVVSGAQGAFELSLYCGRKRLATAQAAVLKSGVEMGPPLSRLGAGVYPLWAALRLQNGAVISSPVTRFEIVLQEAKE